jgi:phenolic acid decarboxylase
MIMMNDFSGKRFEVIYKQGAMEEYRVLVDKATGVNYLHITSGISAGLTVLLDKDGKPVVTPLY